MRSKEDIIKDLKDNSKISFSFTILDDNILHYHCYYPIEDIDVVKTLYGRTCRGGDIFTEDIDNSYATRESLNEFFKLNFDKSLDQVRAELYQFYVTFDPDPDTNIVFEIARENGEEIAYNTSIDTLKVYEDNIRYKKYLERIMRGD